MTTGTWLAASRLLGRSVATTEPYPCRCWLNSRDCGKGGPWGCPCFGAPIRSSMPATCCGWGPVDESLGAE